MTEHTIVAVAGIGVLGAACQWFAWRLRLPAILFLLLSGIAVGPVAGWLAPDAVFGDLLFPLVSLAVGVILFEGALTLRFSEIAGLEKVVRRMVTTGLLATWIVIAVAARLLVGLSWELATLFGAIMVVTGPTVIAPMLRTVRPTARVASILRWEGIVIDPVGALLAVLVFQFILSTGGGAAVGQAALDFLSMVVVGSAVGLAAGFLLGEALRRDWIPEYLYNVVTLALVFGAFAGSNVIEAEAGLLAVTVMGIYLANRKGVPVDEILSFKESLSLLLISGVFILLAARLDLDRLRELGWTAVLVFGVVQFVARPLKVLACAWGSALSWRERALLSWIAPRGIIAAAISALFALELERRGFAQADLLVPLTFVVIIGTVVLQSLTAAPIARALRVAEPEPVGFLLVGANRLARMIGKALADHKLPVLLADTQWNAVMQARAAALRVFYGNPTSEHAELALDLAGIGRLLALSGDLHLNALACARFGRDFGAKRVYSVRPGTDAEALVSGGQACVYAFGDDVTLADLNRRLVRGAEVRSVALDESFGFAEFTERNGDRAVPLFAVDPKGRAAIFASGSEPAPAAGWSIIALLDPDAESRVQADSRQSGEKGD